MDDDKTGRQIDPKEPTQEEMDAEIGRMFKAMAKTAEDEESVRSQQTKQATEEVQMVSFPLPIVGFIWRRVRPKQLMGWPIRILSVSADKMTLVIEDRLGRQDQMRTTFLLDKFEPTTETKFPLQS